MAGLFDGMQGIWVGDETLLVESTEMRFRGRSEARPALGGRALTVDYAQLQGENVCMRGHGTFWKLGDGAEIRLVWVDGSAPEPWIADGFVNGNRLSVEGHRGEMRMRISHSYDGGRLHSVTQLRGDGGQWSIAFDATYRRLPDPALGGIGWRDLSVPNAAAARDFYAEVVGWSWVPVDMGGHEDYVMNDENGDCVAGICHAKGTNQDLPNQWLMYAYVENVAESVKRAKRLGGEVAPAPATMMGKPFAVVQDPAGAFVALIER